MPSVRRVLIVDDDPELRAYVRRSLQRDREPPVEVIEAEDLSQARRATRAGAVDLVLCEAALASGGGAAVVAELRSEPASAATPILLTTWVAPATPERERLERLPGVGLLPKPFNARTLRASVARLLGA